MNKTELATAIADAHGLSKAAAMDILNTTLGAIVGTVASGGDVSLHGFGTFKNVHKPARTARNPKTGESIDVAAKDVPKFVPAGAFEAAVKTGKVALPA